MGDMKPSSPIPSMDGQAVPRHAHHLARRSSGRFDPPLTLRSIFRPLSTHRWVIPRRRDRSHRWPRPSTRRGQNMRAGHRRNRPRKTQPLQWNIGKGPVDRTVAAACPDENVCRAIQNRRRRVVIQTPFGIRSCRRVVESIASHSFWALLPRRRGASCENCSYSLPEKGAARPIGSARSIRGLSLKRFQCLL